MFGSMNGYVNYTSDGVSYWLVFMRLACSQGHQLRGIVDASDGGLFKSPQSYPIREISVELSNFCLFELFLREICGKKNRKDIRWKKNENERYDTM